MPAAGASAHEYPPPAVVDTNIWISAFINPSGAPARVLDAFLAHCFQPILSEALLTELEPVLARPRIQRVCRTSAQDIAVVLENVRDRAIMVTPTGLLHACRDPDDDVVLETAVLGQAKYLITRDDDIKRDLDLIARLEAHGVQVVTVAKFLQLL